MRVLFLDVDGVLNSDQTIASRPAESTEPGGWGHRAGFDPRHVALLRPLLTVPDFAVVFSSSWRKMHHVSALAAMLRQAGLNAVVAGSTPTGPDGRGEEIAAWLALNRESVASFCVVDDDSCDMERVEHRLVQTDSGEGLTAAHVEAIAHRLGEPVSTLEWDHLTATDLS